MKKLRDETATPAQRLLIEYQLLGLPELEPVVQDFVSARPLTVARADWLLELLLSGEDVEELYETIDNEI